MVILLVLTKASSLPRKHRVEIFLGPLRQRKDVLGSVPKAFREAGIERKRQTFKIAITSLFCVLILKMFHCTADSGILQGMF